MLDPDHPMTPHVIAAARAEQAIFLAARRMTSVNRQERARLRDGCTTAFTELRRLSRGHFADRPGIPLAIDDLERALSELATQAGVPELGPSAENKCPACAATLKACGRPAPGNPTESFCSSCFNIIMQPLSRLESWDDGFGTEVI